MKKLLLPILLLFGSALNADRLLQFDHVHQGSLVTVDEKPYTVLSINTKHFDDKKRELTVTTKFVICKDQADNQYYLYKHINENHWAGSDDWYEFHPLSLKEYYWLTMKLNLGFEQILSISAFCAYGYAMSKYNMLPLVCLQALAGAFLFCTDQWL